MTKPLGDAGEMLNDCKVLVSCPHGNKKSNERSLSKLDYFCERPNKPELIVVR